MGLDEPLVDDSPASGTHKLLLSTISQGKTWRRKEGLNNFQPLLRLRSSQNGQLKGRKIYRTENCTQGTGTVQ